jgi:hypothetical protein
MLSGAKGMLFGSSESKSTAGAKQANMVDEEALILDIMMCNDAQRATPGMQQMGHIGYLRDGLPKPGLGELPEAVVKQLPWMYSPEQAESVINVLLDEYNSMNRFDNKREMLRQFYHNIIIGNSGLTKEVLSKFIKASITNYRTQTVSVESAIIADFIIAMMIANAVQSLKIFLIHFNRYAPKQEVDAFYQHTMQELIKSGKHEIIATMLECGGINVNTILIDGSSLLVSTLQHIALTSWRMDCLAGNIKLKQEECHKLQLQNKQKRDEKLGDVKAGKLFLYKNQRIELEDACKESEENSKRMDEIFKSAMESWNSQLQRAEKILNILVSTYHANPDLAVNQHQENHSEDNFGKLVYLNLSTARQLADAYLQQLESRRNIDIKIKSQLTSLFELVSSAPQNDFIISASDQVSSYFTSAINAFK